MRRRILLLSLSCLALLAGPSAAAGAGVSEAVEWLQGYLRIDTTNPPGGEHRAAAYLAAILHREGIATELHVTPGGRTSLVARLRAAPGASDVGALVLLHHMDTVAAGPGWTVDPFAGLLRQGRLYGRGAVDAKGLGIAHLAAFVELRRRALPLRRDVVLVAVADEETGGGEGTAWLLERRPGVFAGAAAVLNEGGSNRVVAGRTLWWGIEVAQKRPLWLELETTGRPGHAAGLRPHSALHTLVAALGRLLARPARWRVSAPARTYLAALAPLHGERWRRIFERIDEHIDPEGPKSGLLPGMGTLFLDTVQVTILAAGEQINVIPERARAQVDVRLLPDTDDLAFLADLRAVLGDQVAARVLLAAPPAAPSPASGPLYDVLAGALGGAAPVVPAFISGFTDSRYFRERGVPAYGVFPFALNSESLAGIHGADEHVPVDLFEQGVERMTAVVQALAGR